MQVISVSNQYASSLQRLVAFIIDRMLISILVGIFLRPILWHISFSYPEDIFGWGWHFTTYKFWKEVIIITYFAFMESSAYQATLGKIVMGIKVVGENGQRIELPKAILRNLSKILSAFILGIGYIMIIFDERKQGLHDKIADTFVVKQ